MNDLFNYYNYKNNNDEETREAAQRIQAKQFGGRDIDTSAGTDRRLQPVHSREMCGSASEDIPSQYRQLCCRNGHCFSGCM